MKFLAILIAVLTTAASQIPTQPAERIVQEFPAQARTVHDKMILAAQNFNSAYGRYARIERIIYKGTVENPRSIVDDMLGSGVIFESDFEQGEVAGHPRMWRISSLHEKDPRLPYLRDSLALNVRPGDVILAVDVRDLATNGDFESLNSMSLDGNRFSGVFFATARLRGGFGTNVRQPNTVCRQEVLTEYLWGAPAESVEGCVRAMCNNDGACEDCIVTETSAFPGFFGSAKILPDAGSPGRKLKGCCEGYFKYAWVTGLKSIKVSVSDFSLAIEGQIGQSGEGSFTVSECCTTGAP